MLLLALFTLLSQPSAASASATAVHAACLRLCEREADCLKKCVSHAELFELRSEFIDAATSWDSSVDTRMKVLRSGANQDALEICQRTGWSMDNKLTCLRSYPTPEVIKNCKKLSPRQEDQVRCVREGKTEAEIDACMNLVLGTDQRFACLELQVTAQEIHECGRIGSSSKARLKCLEQAKNAREDEGRRFMTEVRERVAREQGEKDRMPASKGKGR